MSRSPTSAVFLLIGVGTALAWLWLAQPSASDMEAACLDRPAPAGDIPKTAYCDCFVVESLGAISYLMRTFAPDGFGRDDIRRARNTCSAVAMSASRR